LVRVFGPFHGPAQPEHSAQFSRALLLGQDRLHLLEGEAKVFQRDEAVQVGELAGLIETVSAGRIDAGRVNSAREVSSRR
jgi:hypothetical protein